MHSLLRGLGQDGHRVGGGRGFSSCASWNVPVWSDVARVANCVTGTGAAGRYSKGGSRAVFKGGVRIHYNTSFYHYNTSLKSIQKLVNTSQIHVNVPPCAGTNVVVLLCVGAKGGGD